MAQNTATSIEGKKYTLEELYDSTLERAQYNLTLAMQSLERGDEEETTRFIKQGKGLISQANCAKMANRPDWLIENRDW